MRMFKQMHLNNPGSAILCVSPDPAPNRPVPLSPTLLPLQNHHPAKLQLRQPLKPVHTVHQLSSHGCSCSCCNCLEYRCLNSTSY